MSKHPGGRPSKYDPSMLQTIEDYIADCSKKRNLPSVAGLALELNVSKVTIYDWANPDSDRYNEEFSNTLEKVLQEQEKVTLNNSLNSNWNAAIAKLVLANHGYHDKTDVTSGGEKIGMQVEYIRES